MPIKITKKLFLKDMPRNISKRFSRELKDKIEIAILEEIVQGKSPVRGHTFEEYSDGYAKKKGGKKPVDMTLTGKMLKSLKVVQNRYGQLLISFKDKKANWHQKGEGKLPERKLLPTDRSDTFNTKITKLIKKVLNLAVKKEIKKQ